MSQKTTYSYVVIGGGIAGVSSVRAIRALDGRGSILLVNDEDRPPYKRTKISKKLAVGFGRNDFPLEPEVWYRESEITLRDGRVEALDAADHVIRLKNGEEIGWGKLVLANGATPWLPPGINPSSTEGVHVVRRAEDVDRLRKAATTARRAVVVGHGVQGVEVAEQLRVMGKEVLLVGSGPRLLSGRLNEALSVRLAALLANNGIELRMNERVEGIRKTAKGLSIRTGAGDYPGEIVVVCTGVRPEVELAKRAGIGVGRGVLVDKYLATSQPDIYAAGDVAEHPSGYVSFLWHAAELQGEIAGANAAGASRTHDCPPFRMKLEVFGDYYFSMNPIQPIEGLELLEENEGGRYRCLSYRRGALRGALMANDKERAKQYVAAVREQWSQAMVEERLPFSGAIE